MNGVSLFAGCGGLDLGFEKAGFNVIWANEFDTSIHDTYRLNHPNTILNTSDVRTLSSSDIPECEGIIGGPPCQAWSEGGKQLGLKDPRGQLFLDYIRIVNAKKPKFFVIENVQGILEEKHKDALNGFLTSLGSIGYRITYELLNAADYKVPQDRFRVFFVGIRKDLGNEFVFPDIVSPRHITLRQAIGDINVPPNMGKTDERTDSRNRIYNHDVYTGPYDAKYMARNRVRSWDEASFTIQAQARNTPQHPQAPKMAYVSSDKRMFAKGKEYLYRRLSIRECARIQTFPDSFRFVYNDIEDGYKMVGNAVPPRLAYFMAIQIQKAFNIQNHIVDAQPIARKISIDEIARQYRNYIIKENISNHPKADECDKNGNVLISLVKSDNISSFGRQVDTIYYTGRSFPSTIVLNKLHYFMPYIKGKGVRDLYYIKVARIGTKQECHPDCGDNSIRIVFELQFIKQLYDDYMPVHLNIWRTFTDTKLQTLMDITDIQSI